MKTFLHFIGGCYYSPEAFVTEAKRYGAQRRILTHHLKKINWGDRILCAFTTEKGIKVVGFFTVTYITGISEEGRKRLEEKGFVVRKVDNGGRTVIRACGSYITGPTYETKATCEEIYECIKETDANAPLFVSGPFTPLIPFYLVDYKFARLAYIEVDFEAIQEALKASPDRRLRGYFNTKTPRHDNKDGMVTTLGNYKKKELVKPKRFRALSLL